MLPKVVTITLINTERRNINLIEDKVIERINELMEYNHWTAYRLAKESNIAYSSLNNLLKKQNCPTVPTLEKICMGFNISVADFFSYETNPLRNPKLSDEEQDIINNYRTLNAREKEVLKVCLQGLCKK